MGCAASKEEEEPNPFRAQAPAAASPIVGVAVADDNPFRAQPAPVSANPDQAPEQGNPFRTESIRPKNHKTPDASGQKSFFSNPDKTHDKKLHGVPIHESITATKESLRKLRDVTSGRRGARTHGSPTMRPLLLLTHTLEPQPPRADLTAKFYHKYADPKNGSSHWALTLPELAEWSHNENFCGSEDVAASVYRDAAQLAAIEELAAKLHGALEDLVVFQLKEASRVVQAGLQGLYLFELEVADATHAQEEASKKLRKAQAAFDASQAEATKAGKIQDAEKREKALASATKHRVAAEGEISAWTVALNAAKAETTRLANETTPAARQAGEKARREAEREHLAAAAEALLGSYDAFALGTAQVLGGTRQVGGSYEPVVKKKAPKEKGDRFAAFSVQWGVGQQRCEAAIKQLADFKKHGLECAPHHPHHHPTARPPHPAHTAPTLSSHCPHGPHCPWAATKLAPQPLRAAPPWGPRGRRRRWQPCGASARLRRSSSDCRSAPSGTHLR